MHILLVEDNEMNRDMLVRRLARRGYKMTCACDGVEAVLHDHGFTGAFVLAGAGVISSDRPPDVPVSALPPFWRETQVHGYNNALVWTADRARRGVRIRNIHTSQDFVLIRSTAGGTKDMPDVGDHRKK